MSIVGEEAEKPVSVSFVWQSWKLQRVAISFYVVVDSRTHT